jgi:hypothetical protein
MFNKPGLIGDKRLLARHSESNNSAMLTNAFMKNPALARLAAPNPISKSPKSVSFRRASRLVETRNTVSKNLRCFQISENYEKNLFLFLQDEPMGKQKRSDSKDSSTSSGSSNFGILSDELPDFQAIEQQSS